ncbi:MAG: competence/damage-inducible protein A [Candidatus Omnitrophica bacterium]|nr:competence/damage-inducible protein A [Candidatus Omnitrophota bacterium]MCM8793948.1 competence/damage-inducible protein A [Candidatus Omnitrophota bacterium]
MKAEIISIGTEILLGHILNTNASYLSQKLAELGIDVYFQSTVGDNPKRLSFLLRQALKRAEIIITTGGLGPTIDDITLETITQTFHCRLILRKKILSQIENHFKKRGLKMPSINKRQAYLPENAYVLENKIGTAPGFILRKDKKLLIVLPGPPSELIPMFEEKVIPFLKEKLKITEIIFTRTLKISGLCESEIAEKIKDLLKLKPPLTVGIYAHPQEIELKITAKAKNKEIALRGISQIESVIRKRFGEYIFGKDEETLEEVVGRVLTKKRKTLAVAESCSGGLIAHRLTNVPGSSHYFISGIVAYSQKEKVRLLKVPVEVIKKYGAVSKEVAEIMAKNVRKMAKADIGIGVTGIAGPKGGSSDKPVGLVYIGISTENKTEVKEYRFSGERFVIKLKASQEALDIVRKKLLR